MFNNETEIPKFQFLLVRLKDVEIEEIAYNLEIISIPTGTIKSHFINRGSRCPKHFNSYWYD